MGTLKFIDAAFPGSYPAADGFCFYAGGDTPHVWSTAEVAALKSKYRFLLPIYVRSNPPGPGAAADVAKAVSQLRLYGVPQGSLVAWDMETAADAAYTAAVYGLLSGAGYKMIDYGSQSFVTGNRIPDGYYWGAQWTGVSHFAPGDEMTQYASFAAYDESLAQAVLPFWDTRPAPPPPPPSPVPSWLADLQSSLGKAPVLSAGSRDVPGQPPVVHLVQLLVTGRGAWNHLGAVTQLTQDGDYGPKTAAGVKAVQQHYGLAADGVTDPKTLAVLVTR
jgi:peptidoglycan hydrolase-like protein with peptidoglycan-binding domain